MNKGKMLIGIFSGLITGAVIGVLFAPYKGSVTRRKIIKRSDDYTDAAKEKLNEYVEIINDEFLKVKKEISNYTDLLKGKIMEFKKSKDATMN